MIAITDELRLDQNANESELFMQLLPAIKRQARRAFSDLGPQERDEAVSEVIANAFATFRRLAERGKLDVAYPSPLARFAVAQVRAGRRVGNKPNVRDVFSFLAQRRYGFRVESWRNAKDGYWLDAVTDNTVTGVHEQVAFRLDFADWLQSLSARDRQLIRFLALGNTTSEAARKFKISSARISQMRSELKAKWQQF
jgi:hypothetical protein